MKNKVTVGIVLLFSLLLVSCNGPKGDKVKVTPLMDDAISNYIVNHYKTIYPDTEKQIEVHKVYGAYKQREIITVYMYSFFSSFNKATKTEGQSGHALPARIKLKKDGNGFKVIEYKEPSDGKEYSSSIKRLFPSRYVQKALSDSGNLEGLRRKMEKEAEVWLKGTRLGKGGCPDAEIDWIDVLKIEDIQYEHPQLDQPMNAEIERGKKIGDVKFMMANNACSNHKMKDGDAAFLSIGTDVYEVKGYSKDLMVTADDKIYLADRNDKAKTVGELYPVKGKVKDIYFESTEDGRVIHTFSKDSTDQFIKEWLPLKLVDPQKLASENNSDTDRLFIRIELENGVAFRVPYWKSTNNFHFGAKGSKEIKRIITKELESVE